MLGFFRERANEIHIAEQIATITLDAATRSWDGDLGREQTLLKRIAICEALTTEVFIRQGDSEKLTSLYDRYLQKKDELVRIQKLPSVHPDTVSEMLPLASQIIEATSTSEMFKCGKATYELLTGNSAPREISAIIPCVFTLNAQAIAIANMVRIVRDPNEEPSLTLNPLALLAGLALIGYGYADGGMLGALTGSVAALGIGSGLAILSNQKDAELSTDKTERTSQRIGGILATLLCGVGAFYGGWRYGWAWGLGGYIIGALSTVVIALRVK